MMRFINILFYTIFITLLLGIAGLLVGSMLPIPGNIEMKIVKSGSMEPAIATGSVVIVKPEATYARGDIITFGKDTKVQIPTTHRIIEVHNENGAISYTVKGDANEEADPNPVQRNEVIGKVVFHVPYIGFVLDFARQPLGFGLLIGVPAALVILEEVFTIFKETRAALRRRKRGDRDDDAGANGGGTDEHGAPLRLIHARRRPMDEIFVPMWVQPGIFHKEWWQKNLKMHKDAYGTATMLVMGLVFTSSLMAGGAGGTISYFSDIERSIGNIFQAGSGPDFLSGTGIILTDDAPQAAFFQMLSTDEPEGEVLGANDVQPDGALPPEPPLSDSGDAGGGSGGESNPPTSPEDTSAQMGPFEPTPPEPVAPEPESPPSETPAPEPEPTSETPPANIPIDTPPVE